MKNKKFLLGLSLCLGGIATVVPLTLTSCSMNKQPISIERPSDSTSESSKYKEFIGRNVKWTDREGNEYYGTLIKVQNNKIWIDTFFDPSNKELIGIKEFALPLELNNFFVDPDEILPKDKVIALLEKSKLSFPINYIMEVESPLNRYLSNEKNENGKSIANEMLTIFKTKMTTFTAEKLEEAILHLSSNDSLDKLRELINYYVDTFVWAREEFFYKLLNLIEIPTTETEAILEIPKGITEIATYLHNFSTEFSKIKYS